MSTTFYVDPIAKATELGILVQADNITSPMLNSGESGMIIKDENNIIIYYCEEESIERQRFTIAHELGHYVCGHLVGNKKMFRDGTKSYSRDNYDIQEYEANNYAAELLMPKYKVDFLIEQEGMTDVIEMAQIFKVSPKAMMIRLKNLGWIDNEY